MTTFTRDPDVINAEWLRLTGGSRDWSRALERFRYFAALTDEHGLMIFTSEKKNRANVQIIPNASSTAAEKRAMVNRGIRWVFANTPVYVVSCRVGDGEVELQNVAPHINGAFLANDFQDTTHLKITLASLAKHYGPQTVIDELNAKGRTAKANRLQAAWDAWKARQP